MNLKELVNRNPTPEPWSEGEKIPWNDPEFSARMLEHHLTQEHDMASRRLTIINKHCTWINKQTKPHSKILDLGCGPGLYSERLTEKGHTLTGIDFGPASIKHAKEQAKQKGLDIDYKLEDIRTADYGTDNDLVLFIYGEFNVFKTSDIKQILTKAYKSLTSGGKLIIEPNRYETIKNEGTNPPTWYTTQSGLFSPRPHICLTENFWHPTQNTATTRYIIIDAETGETTLHASSMIAYTRNDYKKLLEKAGFTDIEFHESLTGEETDQQKHLEVVVAHKK